jgi:hypothetical protein
MKKLLLIIILSLSFSSVAEVRCGGDLWNIQELVTQHDSFQVMITKHAFTKGGEFIDGQFYDEYGKLTSNFETLLEKY